MLLNKLISSYEGWISKSNLLYKQNFTLKAVVFFLDFLNFVFYIMIYFSMLLIFLTSVLEMWTL